MKGAWTNLFPHDNIMLTEYLAGLDLLTRVVLLDMVNPKRGNLAMARVVYRRR